MESYRRFAHDRWMACQIYLVAILIDISGSMEQSDWPPSRLHGAMAAVEGLLDTKYFNYPNDWVGLVGFSDTASVLHPLVRIGDGRQSMRQDPALIKLGPSTNITAGLSLAGGMLAEAVDRVIGPQPSTMSVGRHIIIVTDGHHNDGPSPVPVAQELQRNGVVIDVIGIGTRSEIDDTCARALASIRSGQPSYCFIGDAGGLLVKMTKLAHHHIRPL